MDRPSREWVDVRFPDGTEVRGASLRDRAKNAAWRQYGLYLDPAWSPTWRSDVIPWPDYGLPRDSVEAARAIQRAFAAAKKGCHIEVGCVGGLGRTGTVLACMAVLAGVSTDKAVQWVRDNYHPDAVETDDQAQWVVWFGEWILNTGLDTRE